METKKVVLTLLLVVTVLCLGPRVSARRLYEDAGFRTSSSRQSTDLEVVSHEHIDEKSESELRRSYLSTVYQNLEEIDRLKLSINKLICGSMEEGCDHMDDAADHSDTADNMTESFATLNPLDHVKEY